MSVAEAGPTGDTGTRTTSQEADMESTNLPTLIEGSFDQQTEQRTALRTRHSAALTSLMEAREDLRGVHALADFVDDSVRWSA